MSEKIRIKWIDVVKCFGIFAIFIGHLGSAAGRVYPWVFTHHVALFFFISGCSEAIAEHNSICKTVVRVFKRILVPWLVFAVISIVVYILNGGYGADRVFTSLITVAKGTVRNRFYASSLWFLTCIAVMQVIFSVIKKVKIKPLILLICLILTAVSCLVFKPIPIVEPKLVYNIDSALFYISFYAIGYVTFPYLQKLLNSPKRRAKIAVALTGVFSLAYAALVFFGKDPLARMGGLYSLISVREVLRPLVIIWGYIVIAKLLENIPLLNSIGQNTLYLCGSEYIAKTVFVALIAVFGLKLDFSAGLTAYAYTALLLVAVNRFLVPLEKKLFDAIYKFPATLFEKKYADSQAANTSDNINA